jgi:hypothetical protein
MKKVIKYTGDKMFMYPNGKLATKDTMLKDFPAILTFTHIIETDEAEQMCFAVQNLSAMRGVYGIDSSLTEDEAIAKIEEIINTPAPEPEPSAEERIASALEFQNLVSLEDVE